MLKDAAARALASSASNNLASWASPTSGATTSRMRRPRIRRPFASWSAAASSRCFSARATTPASTKSVGRASTASTITAAWSVRRPPAVSAIRTVSWASPSRSASLASRWASVRVILVWWAHQFVVDVAPRSSPTSHEVACRATRSSSSATWDRNLVNSTSVEAVSAAPIDHNDTSESSPAPARADATKAATRCRGSGVSTPSDMRPAKHRPLTVRAPKSGFSTSASRS